MSADSVYLDVSPDELDGPDTGSLVFEDQVVRQGYVILERAVLLDTRLSPSARLLYAVLKHHAWQENECNPGVARLQAEMGASHVSIKAWVDELVDHGYVSRKRRGLGKTNAYVINRLGLERKIDGLRSETGNRHGSKPDGATDRKILSTNNTQVTNTQVTRSDSNESSIVATALDASKAARAASDPRPAEVFSHYRAKIQPAAKLEARKQIAARLKTWSADELKQAIDRFAADSWWVENNGKRGAEWFFGKDSRIEQFLALTPRQETKGTNAKDRPGSQLPSGSRTPRTGQSAVARPDRFAKYATVPDWSSINPRRNGQTANATPDTTG